MGVVLLGTVKTGTPGEEPFLEGVVLLIEEWEALVRDNGRSTFVSFAG